MTLNRMIVSAGALLAGQNSARQFQILNMWECCVISLLSFH